MFGKRIQLFKLFGFKVGVDISWFILAIFVTWSLAVGLFPYYFEGFSTATYWYMGIAGALGLFFSIVFHEFCHSIVARHYGLPMKGITLFIFGGVAEMDQEPQNAKSEFLMAIAGPISSILFASILLGIFAAGQASNWPRPVTAVLQYLAWLNYILAIFNLMPAFPLDGGRVLRSILWGIKKDLRWATRIAAFMGSAFGFFLIILGVLNFFTGNLLGGVWLFLIGMFIRGASQMSYKQMLMRRALGDEPVEHFMQNQPVTVPASTTIQNLVEEYFYKYHYKMFPVTEGDQLVGCVTSKDVKQKPREQWPDHQVKEITEPYADENSVTPHTQAVQALGLMNKTQNSRLMVVRNNHLEGIITLKDLLKFLSMKIDFEGE